MSISTGDSRRSAPKKSTTAAAAGAPADETASPDEPVGGVLPVKKTTRPANATGRTSSGGTGGAKTAAKTTAAKAGSGKTVTKATGKSGSGGKGTTASPLFGGKAASGGKGGGRRPVAPVRVSQSRNWGPILLYVATGVVALAIITVGAWPAISERFQPTWQERAAAIPGILNYMDPESEVYDPIYSQQATHPSGVLEYPVSPPVGGNHNGRWQNCMGDVYPGEIAKEHAVHSLEHGAVWVTYRPDLPQDQVDKLASKVDGREFTMMSQFPDLDSPISLQAWGYQLKVDNADDPRIDDFIDALRRNATQEPTAGCSSGITATSSTPFDFGDGM